MSSQVYINAHYGAISEITQRVVTTKTMTLPQPVARGPFRSNPPAGLHRDHDSAREGAEPPAHVPGPVRTRGSAAEHRNVPGSDVRPSPPYLDPVRALAGHGTGNLLPVRNPQKPPRDSRRAWPDFGV